MSLELLQATEYPSRQTDPRWSHVQKPSPCDGISPTLLFLLIYSSMQHKPAQLLLEFSNLFFFSALRLRDQTWSLHQFLHSPNQSISQLRATLLIRGRCRNENTTTPCTRELLIKVLGQQLAQENAYHVSEGKTSLKAVPRGSHTAGGFLLGLKLQVPVLLFPLLCERPCLGTKTGWDLVPSSA